MKHAVSLFLFLLEHGDVKQADLLEVIPSNMTIEKLTRVLEEEGYISIKKEFAGRRVYHFLLTEKGKRMAEQLKRAEDIEKGIDDDKTYEMPPNLESEFKDLSAMVHFNVKDDHIAIAEHNYDGTGKYRIVYVYTKPNGHNIMRLWCEVDQTFECPHTKYAWTLPDVQELLEKLYHERMNDERES